MSLGCSPQISEDKTMNKRNFATIDGNEAVAQVVYRWLNVSSCEGVEV